MKKQIWYDPTHGCSLKVINLRIREPEDGDQSWRTGAGEWEMLGKGYHFSHTEGMSFRESSHNRVTTVKIVYTSKLLKNTQISCVLTFTKW